MPKPKTITPAEAYKLALEDIKSFKAEWDAFASEDARRNEVLEE